MDQEQQQRQRQDLPPSSSSSSSKTITLDRNMLNGLVKGLSSVERQLEYPNDLGELYASLKTVTNRIERIARDNEFQPSHLTFRKDNGVIYIVQDSQKRKWGTPTARQRWQQRHTNSKSKKKQQTLVLTRHIRLLLLLFCCRRFLLF
jgi:hypothetical protein